MNNFKSVKNAFYLGLPGFMLCVACRNEYEHTPPDIIPGAPEEEMVLEMPTTAMIILPFRHFEPPYYLDSISHLDTPFYSVPGMDPFRVDWHTTCYFPQSENKDHAKFNTIMNDVALSFIAGHEAEDSVIFNGLDACIWISGFGVTQNVASAIFTYQDYYSGAAHYNHGYQSVHYDLEKNRTIRLTDLLKFETENDKQKFCDAFNPDASIETPEVYLEPADFTAEQDFDMYADGIALYFDDYDKGPSMTTLYIPYSKFRGYVNPGYKKLFEN